MVASSVTCDDKFECSSIDCTESFTTQQALLEHKTEVHDAVKPGTTSDLKKPAAEDQQPTPKSKLDEGSSFDSDSTDIEDGEEDGEDDNLSSSSAGDPERKDPSMDTITSNVSTMSVKSPSPCGPVLDGTLLCPIIGYTRLPIDARPRTMSGISLDSSTFGSLSDAYSSLEDEESGEEGENYTYY